jgi:hypothetical protein
MGHIASTTPFASKVKSKKPLLSICVPTHDRLFYLDCLIESIRLSEFKGHEIEILISNDASTDQTKTYLDDLVKEKVLHPSLKVVHQTKKRDWMEHMMELPLMASGVYVWIIGDDDLLMPGAVDFVLAFIKKKKPDVLLLNKTVKSEDLRRTLKPRQHTLDGPAEFSSLIDMACRFGILTEIGFTSCLIFRREPVVEEDPWPWLNTRSIYAQTFRLFPAFRSAKCIAVDNLCVVHRQNNQRSDQTDAPFYEALERIPHALLLLHEHNVADRWQLNSILEEERPDSDESTTLLTRLLSIINGYPELIAKIKASQIGCWRQLSERSKSMYVQKIFSQIEEKLLSDENGKKDEATILQKKRISVLFKTKRETLRIVSNLKSFLIKRQIQKTDSHGKY